MSEPIRSGKETLASMKQHLEFPNLTLGPFQLYQQIGSGATGEVWSGVHLQQDVAVAIKIIHISRVEPEKQMRMFRHEVQSVAAMNHPGIVSVFDYGRVTPQAEDITHGRLLRDSPFLAMELAPYDTLDTLQAHLSSWKQLYTLLTSLLDALAHAHARGVIHRDLKPANILITDMTDIWPGLKLSDFGLSFIVEPTRTNPSAGKACGTPAYMAPEQFDSYVQCYRQTLDLYSLGCLTYELVTGKPPFQNDNIHQMIYHHYKVSPPPLEPRFELPEGFEAWLMCLLEKDPDRRFQCAADAAWALAQIEKSRSIAPGPSWKALVHNIHPAQSTKPVIHSSWPLANLQPITEMNIHSESTILLEPEKPSDALPLPMRETLTEPESKDTSIAAQSPPFPPTWDHQFQPIQSIRLVGAGLGLYSLRTLPFLGREQERNIFWNALFNVAQTRTTRTLFLTGPTGVGKSRLAGWLAERAAELGAADFIKVAHSVDSYTRNDLADMVARYYGCYGLPRHEMQAVIRRHFTKDGHCDPYEWYALTEILSPATELDLRRLDTHPVIFGRPEQRFVILFNFLKRIIKNKPLILWTEDVHWSSNTLRFIYHIIKAHQNVPILVIATVNDETLQNRPDEAELIDTLMEFDEVESYSVQPLCDSDQSKLIHELLYLDDPVSYEVHKRSAGNPMFAVDLVGDWVNRGMLKTAHEGFVLDDGMEAVVPEDVYDVWIHRIDTFFSKHSQDVHIAIELAATLGHHVNLREWEALCAKYGVNIPSSPLMEQFESRRHVVRDEHGWTFTHSMFRETIEQRAKNANQLKNYHRSCALVLEELYNDHSSIAERLGHHYMRAHEYERALDPLLLAARNHRTAGNIAAALYQIDQRERALKKLEIAQTDLRWAQGWLLKSLIYENQSRPDLCEKWARKVLDIAAHLSCEKLTANANLRLGHSRAWQGDFEQARQYLHHALDAFETTSDNFNAAVCLQLIAREYTRQGELNNATQLLHKADEKLSVLNEPITNAKNYFELFYVAYRQGQIEIAHDYLNKALDIAETHGHVIAIVECLNALAEIARYQNRFVDAEALYNKSLARMESVGLRSTVVPRVNLAFMLIQHAEYAAAKSMLMRCYEDLYKANRPIFLCYALVGLIPCTFAEKNWAQSDYFIEQSEILISKHQIVERDIAMIAEIAAKLAFEAGENERGQRIQTLADAQKQKLDAVNTETSS